MAHANGPAHRFLLADDSAELHLSVVALGEYAEGFTAEGHPAFQAVANTHTLLPVDEATSLLYGRIARQLRESGQLIGSNDLWIACTSLRHGLPVVTADVNHFQRIDGLEVVPYREG